jgi:hypothetical protein
LANANAGNARQLETAREKALGTVEQLYPATTDTGVSTVWNPQVGAFQATGHQFYDKSGNVLDNHKLRAALHSQIINLRSRNTVNGKVNWKAIKQNPLWQQYVQVSGALGLAP